MINRFNVRVYGLLVRGKEVLVCDEERFGKRFTKFPGGALEFGEGLAEALVREWQEETGTRIKISAHYYTTDFFQVSAFNPQEQLLSIYYKVDLLEPFRFRISTEAHDYDLNAPEKISWRWLHLNQTAVNQMTFPIDRKVVLMLADTIRS